MKTPLIATLIFLPSFLYGQLNVQRTTKIKAATVQIIADSSKGTGFFIDSKGTVATCFHVLRDALISKHAIYAKTNDGNLLELQSPQFTDSGVVHAIAYDLYILKPVKPLQKPSSFLKLGDYNKVLEGEEVYTCGYPFGDSVQFISKGMVSNKITKPSVVPFATPKITFYEKRDELLLDITSNHGNSGGALIRIGSSAKVPDEVIGIIDYTVTPIANYADTIVQYLKKYPSPITNAYTDSSGKFLTQYNSDEFYALFAKWFSIISFGVNGAVSVNHLLQLMKEMKQ